MRSTTPLVRINRTRIPVPFLGRLEVITTIQALSGSRVLAPPGVPACKPPLGQATPRTRADAIGNTASCRSWRRMKLLSERGSDAFWWHQAQRSPALWPCGSWHSGFGQGRDPRGMSHRVQRFMAPPKVSGPTWRRTGWCACAGLPAQLSSCSRHECTPNERHAV